MKTLIRKGNFSFNPNPECENGDTFDNFNMTQLFPHTPVCSGKTGLILGNGNQLNCDFPGDTQGTRPLHKSFCSHEHPEWIERGLPECPEDCEHELVDERDVVTVDGVEYILQRYYQDKVVP